MKNSFNFNLGNRGLLPEEAHLADSLNRTLIESAQRNGRQLRASCLVRTVIILVAGKPILRAAQLNREPVMVPLANQHRGGKDERVQSPYGGHRYATHRPSSWIPNATLSNSCHAENLDRDLDFFVFW